MSRLKPFKQNKSSLMKTNDPEKNFDEMVLDQDFFNSLMAPKAESNPIVSEMPKKELNPVVASYIHEKIRSKNTTVPDERSPATEVEKKSSFLDQYSDEARQKSLEAATADNGSLAIAQLLGGIGDAVAGRSSADTAKRFDAYRERIRENTVGEFDRNKKSAIENYQTKRMIEQNELTDAQRSRDMDVNSEESKMAQVLAKKMNPAGDYSNLTAFKFKEMSPVFEKMYAVEQARLARQDAAATRAESKAQREYEKNQSLETTFGQARTADDAKQLKAAAETKAKFDRQLQELINLRKEKGVEYLDRDAVARAKQLSRDLLLGYKDLAKLGVLSQSDEAILNDIIPNDPLGQDWAPGQDPTLHKLEKFQGDVNSDFKSRLDQRLRDPNNKQRKLQEESSKRRFPMQVKRGNQIATVSSEVEYQEALSEGWK